jgi:hypothetical protein
MAGLVAPAPIVKHRSRGVVRIEVDLTTTAGGVVDATAIGSAWGRLVGVFYNGGLDASATVTLKDAKTGATLFTHTTGTEGTPATIHPTDIVTDKAGADLTPAATAPNVRRDIVVSGRMTITVAGGGNAETGKYAFLVDESFIGQPLSQAN